MITDKNKILLLLTFAFMLLFAYVSVPYIFTFFGIPYDTDLHQPFPFFKFKTGDGITWAAYFDYAFTRLAILVLVYVIVKLTPDTFKYYVKVFAWLYVGYFVEYFLIYNQPFAWYQMFPVWFPKFFMPLSYSLFAGSSMIFILFRKWTH